MIMQPDMTWCWTKHGNKNEIKQAPYCFVKRLMGSGPDKPPDHLLLSTKYPPDKCGWIKPILGWKKNKPIHGPAKLVEPGDWIGLDQDGKLDVFIASFSVKN
jgi:hypothetical protein